MQPWRELGGVVPERSRWLGRVIVTCGFLGGYLVARAVRSRLPSWSFTDALRRLVLPALGGGALALVAGRALGSAELVSLVTSALAAWWGGIEAGAGAVPMMERACPRSPESDSRSGEEWIRPW